MDSRSSVPRAICLLFLMSLVVRNEGAIYDIKHKGAKGDGRHNDGPAIECAWKDACACKDPSTVLIPPGEYMSLAVTLNGPCNNPVEIKATGATIKAPCELNQIPGDSWILIQNVNRLTLTGGIFDGQGQKAWAANDASKTGKCKLPVSIRLNFVKESLLRGVTVRNSKFFHFNLLGCDNTRLDNIVVDSPGTSVNTDGIHIGRSTGVTITNANIKTGDDCISFGDGCRNIHVNGVTCGPGHGISVGSLGKHPGEEPVDGIWVNNARITGTMNGVRVKTWPGSRDGIAKELHFENIMMENVGNPILIDQEYCPFSKKDAESNPSKIRISNVSFKGIKGTSASKSAIKLICSKAMPCQNVKLENIDLKYVGPKGGEAVSECKNVKPMLGGGICPKACGVPAGSVVE